jgi:hypothetical protein
MHLENLDVFDTILRAPAVIYTGPFFDDLHDIVYFECWQTEVMPRMETYDVASTLDRFRCQQGMECRRRNGSWGRENGSIIVLECHGGLIIIINCPIRASVAWA